MKLKLFAAAALLLPCIMAQAQVNSNYTIARWQGFKTAAISYTWDDLTKKQLSDALPLYNKYGFKMTFNVVINWTSDWNALNTAANNGHEVACHTVTHVKLSTASVSTQDTELKNAQATINSNITSTKCVTVAYPECVIGDRTTISKYFIAGRTCDGLINNYSPSDFYKIGAYICGNTGVNTPSDLNKIANDAYSQGGWGVYLFHGINADGGYSPIESSVLDSHLSNMNTNKDKYWVGTFGEVAKYIKERNAASLTETTITADSLQTVIADNLDNTIYTAQLTVRRAMPTGWAGARVYLGKTLINSTTSVVNNVTYVTFNIAPDKGTIYIANTAPKVVPGPVVTATPIDLIAGWNMIGCPIKGSTSIATALSGIWANVDAVKNQDAFYLKTADPMFNQLKSVTWGQGYMIHVTKDCQLNW